MARKPRDVIEQAAILSRDAMKRATSLPGKRIVPIEAIVPARGDRLTPSRPPKPAEMPTRRVFISYARQDRVLAKGLARHLEARGIDVWWDFRLFPGDKFRERILTELNAASAVIVIWSDAAAKSDFVLDEAGRAKAMGKLLTTLSPGFAVEHIPLGFGQSHAVDVGDRAQVIETLAKYGIAPRRPRPQPSAQSPLA